MFEVNAFLAMFAVQIVILSILYPAQLLRRIRSFRIRYPREQFPQLYVEENATMERNLTAYRLVNVALALLGAGLLAWFFNYMQRPDWDDGPIEALLGVYFMLQFLPIAMLAIISSKANRQLRLAFETDTRRASLQRRRLFDFVSPFIVMVTALCYPAFIAFVFYIQQHPFPGFAGPGVNIAIITLLYGLTGFAIYKTIYGTRSNPLQSHADRLRAMEIIVKICVYTCLISVVFISLNFMLVLLDMQRWEPLAQSVGGVLSALLYINGLKAAPTDLKLDNLRPTATS